MKVLPILIGVALLAATYLSFSSTTNDSLEFEFTNYMSNFNKNYQSDSEYNFRREIFEKNLIGNNEHNAKGLSYTIGVNKFSDWTDEEFKSMLGYRKNNSRQSANLRTIKAKGEPTLESIDHRESGFVAPVQNQGSCGSCWAFATVASIEGAYAAETGELRKFSESQLVECDAFNWGCLGGWSINALMYFTHNAPILEADYPYRLPIGECEADQHPRVEQVLPYAFRVDDEADSLYEALTHNVVAIAIRAENVAFRRYTGGVIEGEACGTEMDHAVTLVGYEAETDAWIVKNSWGPDWGEEGYVRIKREQGKGVCGINQDTAMPIFHTDDY